MLTRDNALAPVGTQFSKVKLHPCLHHDTYTCLDSSLGNYEAGISGYKHMYFNATQQSAIIWLLTVVYVIALYESMKYLLQLFCRRELRYTMFVLFSSVVYSHYYTYWVYVNYFNDDFYSQFYHQLFFSCTELFSTITVLKLADVNVELTSGRLLIILDIAVLHVLTSGWDQFVTNVIKQEGGLHQVLRDLLFMIPDILHIAIAVYQLFQLAKSKKRPPTHLISNQQFIGSVLLISALWIVCIMM